MSTQENNKSKLKLSTKKSVSRLRQFLLLIGLLFVAWVPFYIEFFLRRPIGEGPAGPKIDSSAFESSVAWTERPVIQQRDRFGRITGEDESETE